MIRHSDTEKAAAPVQKLCLVDPKEIGRHSAWEFDFRQIDPGPTEVRVVLRSSSCVRLAQFDLNRGFHQMGCSPSDTVSFGLPVSLALDSWRGMALDTPGIVNLGRGSEFEGVTRPGFSAVTVSIPISFLEQVSDQLGLALPDDFLRKTMLPVRRRTPALHQVIEITHALLHGDGAPFGDLQQEDLVARLIGAASDTEVFDDQSAFSVRAKAVTRALNHMQDRLGDGVSIGQLCADSGASVRTLTRGFRERFDIGPKAYFNRLRLGRVRSDLLKGSTACSVADAANEWGFWHMGQFAKDYHQMFGELPSETLNGTKQDGIAPSGPIRLSSS